VPEGFYEITPGQMNPNSNYYLSFNVGYPNAYDRAHGYYGGSIMVHGACSSAGCFSMTDQQIAEIYSVAREAFAGGQREIQMQSLPFHMTVDNLAKYRLDPNIAFWKELKTGSDNFDVTGQEVAVDVCNGHYVFNAESADGRSFDPTGACPPLKRDAVVEDEVLAKQKRDDARIAELVAEGVPPVHTVYADGGQNPSFASRQGDVSRPDALAQGPVDVAINGKHKTPSPAQLKAAEAKDLAEANAADKKAAALRTERAAAEDADKPEATEPVADAEPQPANSAPAAPAQNASNDSILTHLFGQQPAQTAAPAPAEAAAEPQPAQPQASAPAQPTQNAFDPSVLTHLFGQQSPQPAAPAPTQAAEQQPAQQTDAQSTDMSRLYTASQPVVQHDAPQTTTVSSADSDDTPQPADVPLPPLRKKAHAQKPVAAQAGTTNATPAATEPAQQPAQPAQQAQAPNTANSLSGAPPIVPQGFSALTTPDH
jgi:hypothetical protein